MITKRKEVEALDRPTHIKKGMLNKINIDSTAITNFSLWLGDDRYKIGVVHVLPAIDLAIGRLENFDKNGIKVYPKFKDYSKPMDPGTSLCKLGFPLSVITSTFDDAKKIFNLPRGAVPLPLFPLEGIYTRTVQVIAENNTMKVNIPLKYIETSSPGLRGQSGGPTFDTKGTIWAIQSKTSHYKLGFGDSANGLTHKEAEHLQNQYLNVGWGIHSQTIIEFCKLNNVSYHLSDY